MNRLARVILAAALVVMPALGASTAVAAEPASPIVRAGVDDFVFESFSADYYLDVDAEGRSTLTTVETFVAVFPEYDQNRGMRRAIPGDYQGAPTDVAVLSITDENGNPRPMEVETDDDGFVLATSRADGFVHGRQTYVFTYTQHNVTRYFENTDSDEFYWDTNGTGWYQPFGSVTARVHVPAALAERLTGNAACYFGYEGADQPCEIASTVEGDETVFEMSVTDVAAYQNLTFAIGFEPQTFVPRDDSYLGSPLAWLQIAALVGLAASLVIAIVMRVTVLADGRGRPTIIAEYTPPKEPDIITSSILIGKSRRAVAAQLVDWAVRGRIRIIEQPAQGWFARGNEYLLQLVDPSGLQGGQLQLAQALFGWQLAPGTGYLMGKTDSTLSQFVRGIIQSATAATKAQGYRARGKGCLPVLPILLALGSAIATFILGITLVDAAIGGALPMLFIVPAIIVVIAVFALVARQPLTEKGAEVRDHLKGLELYIRLAEADRLRMLQSPTTAEREAVSTSDPRQVLDVYEKLLPYAVLFSLEKQWAEELGRYYTEASPDWYSGSSAFNAAVFASSISSMSSSVSTSYSGSSSSSSSGGSGGGGSSGGGGGGGGGGGV
ncbi:DUF2207 domain-containing protein [Antiquaquibacter soli]|uniref:DUF2207 domain-containing protein n=1 Tax=Antiquaquibacter soli TaxID=3064523 RepID=A0ABT9BKU1_9MICO|nr:DUF2207 domain-containing protein [Protaetiibacter sp. WY-16]MDO7881630.1 DUF2207 domain-containing protein [Protaetiibacter sp. WY-16]